MAGSFDDDFAAEPVPLDRRIAWPLAFFAQMGIATALLYMQITSVLALRYGTVVTLIAIAYAGILSAVVGYAICRLAVSTGAGCNILAREVLGFRGASLFSLIFGANGFVYFAVEATIMGSSLKSFFPGLSLPVVLPLLALALIPVVWFGMRLLARIQLLTFLLYGVLLAIAIGRSAGQAGDGWLIYRPADAPPFATGLIEALGTMNSVVFITGLVSADYARFIRPRDRALGSFFTGFVFQAFCFAFSGLLGLWFALRYAQGNPGAYFVTMLGGWGIVFAFATQLRINLSNMYAGSLAFLNMAVQLFDVAISRHVVTVLFGLGMAAALTTDIFSDMTATMAVIGMFTTCFACLVLADYYVVRRWRPSASNMAVALWRWPPLVAILAATTIGSVLQTGILGALCASLASLIAAALQTCLFLLLEALTAARPDAARPLDTPLLDAAAQR